MEEQGVRRGKPRATSDTISFRLVSEYRKKLENSAKAAGVTSHQMARQLLVTALENPSREDLIKDLYELTVTSEFLLEEVRVVHREMALLRGALAGSLSIFLATVGVSEEDVDHLVDDLFKSGEDREV
ncbi:MAG: hypothetical protein KME10_24220 [Plectolyngbya sp. WJT66-NPBG17]|jgi:hypothetical protein|nr:hypothetical protein [Plectolyngbya sp. WJT66-NPBG17]